MNGKHIFFQRFSDVWSGRSKSNILVRLATVVVCLLLFAKLVEKNYIFTRFDERHAQRIQSIFTEKEEKLLSCIDKLELCVTEANIDSCLVVFHEKYARKLTKNGLYFFAYLNDTLAYWSSSGVDVAETYQSTVFDKPYVSLGDISYY